MVLTSRVDLSEDELLEFVVHREDGGSGNTTKNVGSSSLEERLDSLGGNDLSSSVEHALVCRDEKASSKDGQKDKRLRLE